MSVEAAVLELFAEVVGAPPVEGLETTPEDVPDWDSLNHVRLVHAIERRLSVALPENALVERGSLRDLVETIAFASGTTRA